LVPQPLRHFPVHCWQRTPTPIGARGKKGRVGDPVWLDDGGGAALDCKFQNYLSPLFSSKCHPGSAGKENDRILYQIFPVGI